jgi:hypothetical protein
VLESSRGNVDRARRVCNRCWIREDRRVVIDMGSGEEVWRGLLDMMVRVGDEQPRTR